jgi:hypothetical protein
MKKLLPLLITLICSGLARSQVTTPQVLATFGVEGDLQSNYFGGAFVPGSNDDWFIYPSGSGQFVIDTTGAYAITQQYISDLDFRKIPFFRKMIHPSYTLIGGTRRVIDAVFIRDYHGDDSTVFANGSNKNGMSPANWTCPVSQSVPDKNEILDMMVHIRRAGSETTSPLWMFGGVGIEGTSGNRYFDFEMYQTDIFYDRASRRFYGYGADDGHTAWLFDGNGEITRPGDIIFSADYGNSTLSSIEARIWVHQSALSITPTGFDWIVGAFDNDNGSSYGYAGIRPKNNATFYYGVENSAARWAGPFQLIRSDNSLVTTYNGSQFMEFGVNLTVLGLDPVTLLGPGSCGLPFSRVLVKTRASTSFTAELKDFVGPFDFFMPPLANAGANIPVFCGQMSVSQLEVLNPYSTSIYTWTTTDGNIVGNNTGTLINVDAPGTYVVTQQLQEGCTAYTTDTVVVTYDPDCIVLANNRIDFTSTLKDHLASLKWSVTNNEAVNYYIIERSTDGIHYTTIDTVNSSAQKTYASYQVADNVFGITSSHVYYRVKAVGYNNAVQISKVGRIALTTNSLLDMTILNNPVKNVLQMRYNSPEENDVEIHIFDMTGRLLKNVTRHIPKGNAIINIDGFKSWAKGIYTVKVMSGKRMFTDRMMLVN